MKYANAYGHSDVTPFEVVRVISEKTIEVRALNAERDPTWKPEIIPGGFAGHCVNQHTQRWIITPCAEAPIIRIRKRKDGKFYSRNGEKFVLADAPRKFYDYNF